MNFYCYYFVHKSVIILILIIKLNQTKILKKELNFTLKFFFDSLSDTGSSAISAIILIAYIRLTKSSNETLPSSKWKLKRMKVYYRIFEKYRKILIPLAPISLSIFWSSCSLEKSNFYSILSKKWNLLILPDGKMPRLLKTESISCILKNPLPATSYKLNACFNSN